MRFRKISDFVKTSNFEKLNPGTRLTECQKAVILYSHCLLPTVYCPVPNVYCPLSTVHCLLFNVYFPLPAQGLLPTVHCPMPPVYCPLFTAQCLLPTAQCNCDCPLSSAYSSLSTVKTTVHCAGCIIGCIFGSINFLTWRLLVKNNSDLRSVDRNSVSAADRQWTVGSRQRAVNNGQAVGSE